MCLRLLLRGQDIWQVQWASVGLDDTVQLGCNGLVLQFWRPPGAPVYVNSACIGVVTKPAEWISDLTPYIPFSHLMLVVSYLMNPRRLRDVVDICREHKILHDVQADSAFVDEDTGLPFGPFVDGK